MDEDGERSFVLLHFNDVYEIEEGLHEPVAGAARFKTAIDTFGGNNPLVLFSGDVFSPSLRALLVLSG
jgi:5'-nucleotidase